MDGIPVGVGNVYFASPRLAGTTRGVFVLQGSAWTQHLADRVILALGENASGGWWAAGAGFVGFSTGLVIPADEEFTGGCVGPDGLFLAGKLGVWLCRGESLVLVHPLASPNRLRLFLLGQKVCLFADSKTYAWTQGKFTPEPLFQDAVFRDILSVKPAGTGHHLIAYDGLFYLSANGIEPLYAQPFRDLYKRATVGFYVGAHYAVIASYYDGVRAVGDDGQLLWQTGVEQLGGNPYSLEKTKDGFLVGTSSGAVTLFSEAFFRMPLSGEDVHSVGESIHLPSGAINLRTGAFTPNAPLVAHGGLSGDWGQVTLANGKRIAIPGRTISSILDYHDGWAVLQSAALTLLDANGEVRVRLPLVGADSAVVDHDAIWLGCAAGLFRFNGRSLDPVISGHPVRVAQGKTSPVFIFEDTLHFPDGTKTQLPGRVLAVADNFAAIQIDDECFVGHYAAGVWQPLDAPMLPAEISHLRVEGDFLYLVARSEVLRLQLSKTGSLKPGATRVRQETIDGPNFSAPLPRPRPKPWPRPHIVVRENGRIVPVSGDSFSIARVPYGNTPVEVLTSLGGIDAREQIILQRPRPWWLDWPGISLYGVTGIAAVWGLIRWRTIRLARQTTQLKRLVAERTKDLAAALKAREFFFSSVSHEIRNPLNGVVGLCDMLNESTMGARERLLVRTLKGCSYQLRHILDDVLDFARIDRGEMEFHPEVFDVGQALENAARAIDPTLSRVQIEMPADIWVEGDLGKLSQVVTNLVSNALKYGQPTLAKIQVLHSVDAAGYVSLRVNVSNFGPDLTPEEQIAIFTEFHRGENAIRSRVPGSGLGLALSLRIMKALKGGITVTSRGGVTTFSLSITLPRSAPKSLETRGPRTAAPRRVLAIEDEQYNRMVLGHILGQMGYQTDWAVDGVTTLEAIATGNYDLILTDYMLPDTDGVTLARQILAQAGPPAPPIIMVTAYSTREKQEAALAAGISGFVTKPVTQEKLQAAIQNMGHGLQGRRSLDIVRPADRFDLSLFYRMNEGRAALSQFAETFEADFRQCASLIAEPEALRKSAHALRGRALVIHAMALAEQLEVLERMAGAGDPDKLTRICSVIGAMVADLTDYCRAHAFSGSDFSESLGNGVTH